MRTVAHTSITSLSRTDSVTETAYDNSTCWVHYNDVPKVLPIMRVWNRYKHTRWCYGEHHNNLTTSIRTHRNYMTTQSNTYYDSIPEGHVSDLRQRRVGNLDCRADTTSERWRNDNAKTVTYRPCRITTSNICWQRRPEGQGNDGQQGWRSGNMASLTDAIGGQHHINTAKPCIEVLQGSRNKIDSKQLMKWSWHAAAPILYSPSLTSRKCCEHKGWRAKPSIQESELAWCVR